ncbi:MAG: DUF4432 family protein [Phycisphaeraceae bacterium]
MTPPPQTFDEDKFEIIHQVGGIRTATFDHPDAGGTPACRVAMVDTGAGLRFTVAIDRGGDIVEASHNGLNLAYLSANGYKPPNPAYHRDGEWTVGWPGGLVTSCGPQYIGSAREEDGAHIGQHGHHSNTPAALLAVCNPDLRRNEHEMRLDMAIRDTRLFGPIVEVRRTIRATLGIPAFTIEDQITNRGNKTVAHNWLYHVNFGYPLLDTGARLVYRGNFHCAWGATMPQRPDPQTLDRFKTMSDPLDAHAGPNEDGIIIDAVAEDDGLARIGIVNTQRNVGLEMRFSPEELPRLANWRHLAHAGSYVTALEPFHGSLMGKANDDHPLAEQWLKPGETRSYTLTFHALEGETALNNLLTTDSAVTV